MPRIFSLISCIKKDGEKDARTERRQQDCGKVKANGDKSGRHFLDKFFICGQSGCIQKPGILKASSRQIVCSGKPHAKRNPNAASSSQAWQKDARLDVCTGKPVAADEDQESLKTVCTGEELENLDVSEIHARRLSAKEVFMPKSGDHFTFPIAYGPVKLSG